MKILHVDTKVLHHVIKQTESVYGKMTVATGVSHVYKGIKIKYGTNGEAYIDMIDHVKETIDDFPEECTSSVNSPAGTH